MYDESTYIKYITENGNRTSSESWGPSPRDIFIDEVIRRQPSQWSYNDIETFLNKDIEYTFSVPTIPKDEKLRAHLLRTAAYYEISRKFHLAFLSDFMRIPILSTYHATLTKNIRMWILKGIDDSSKAQGRILSLATATPISIPSAAAIFLDEYASDPTEKNLANALSYLMNSFKNHRKKIKYFLRNIITIVFVIYAYYFG